MNPQETLLVIARVLTNVSKYALNAALWLSLLWMSVTNPPALIVGILSALVLVAAVSLLAAIVVMTC